MKNISVVISAFNEEENIKDCLESVGWADEIILVDNSSIDKTVEIGRQYTQKIFTRPNLPMLNLNKNYGFDQTTGDWILNLDADERVTSELRKEIQELDPLPDVGGYEMARKNIIFGKWIEHGLWWPDYQLRLFRKNSGEFPGVHVHEKVEIKGKTEKLASPLLHYNYQTVSQYLWKMDQIYTENEVKNRLKTGEKINWSEAISMPVNDFLAVFFARQGYKDGLHGLVLAFLQSFYALIVFAKTWEAQGFKEIKTSHFLANVEQELAKAEKQKRYWILSAKIQQSQGWLSKICYQMKRKLIS